MSAVDDIRVKVQDRLDELEQEIASLREALAALDAQEARATEEAAAPAGAGRPQAGSRPRAGRRAAGKSRTGTARAHSTPSPELERQLVETGGASAVELARQTGTDYAEVLARIRELEQAARRDRDAA
jgi:peptidoglycan hydrolase CwlO-like protein